MMAQGNPKTAIPDRLMHELIITGSRLAQMNQDWPGKM
jgi:hypothetical protein